MRLFKENQPVIYHSPFPYIQKTFTASLQKLGKPMICFGFIRKKQEIYK